MQSGPTALICLCTSPLTFHKYNFLVRDCCTNLKALKNFSFFSCGTKFDQSNKRRQNTTYYVYLWKHIRALFRIKYVYPALSKVVPLQARCNPEGSRSFRLPDFHDIRHMKVARSSVSGTGCLYPQECSWYAFSPGAESNPGPWYSRKEICH